MADTTASSESLFMVDDAALHDGSWPIIGRIDAQPKVPVPRFKTTFKDESPAFAIYSPETLHVVQVVAVLPGEEAEYERSYVFIRPDIATFECSVAVTFGLLPKDTKPPQPESGDVAESRLLVGLIRSRLLDATPPRAIDFVADFTDKRKAREAARALEAKGLSVKVDSPWYSRLASVTSTKHLVPSYPAIAPEIAWLRNFFATVGGVYDGFGAEVDAGREGLT